MIYNELQQKAINSKAPKVLVTAPAGSGKTGTLIGAILKYIEDNPNANIVAITFTRKAALELQTKIFSDKVSCSTIHSWSLKELNRLAVEHKFKVSILQDNQIQEILKSLSRKCGYYSINLFMLFSYVMGNYNIDISQNVKNKFDKVLREYVEYKRVNRLYDFTDLPLYLYDILEYYSETINNVDGLFVDEFQDVDDIQAKIFRKVNAKKFFYIGDSNQMIYSFRGCGPHNLKDLTDFEHHKLYINYRSYQGIIDYANTMKVLGKNIADTKVSYPCEIICSRKEDEGEVFVVEDEFVCHDVTNNKEVDTAITLTNFLLKRPYILCRSNKQVKEIKGLGYNNVSTIHQAKGLEYDNVIVVDMFLSTEEEVNIAYVACTRAKDGLMICDMNDLYNLMGEILFEYKDEICGGRLF